MKRVPLKRGKTLTRRTPLRPVSVKRRAQLKAWHAITADVYARDMGCRAPGEWGSHGGPCDPHHVLPRGRGGTDTLDNLVTLCRRHHEYAHSHPLDARAIGLLA